MIRIITSVLFALACLGANAATAKPLNILVITADDMNWDSVGAYGCPIPGITPNIDRLAEQGLRFEHAHVSQSICRPSRVSWVTGQYAMNHLSIGINYPKPHNKTLPEMLQRAGYKTGTFGKNHYFRDGWEVFKNADIRFPKKVYGHCTDFFEQAKAEEKPFLLMVHSTDPHKPLAGGKTDLKRRKNGVVEPITRYFQPEDVVLPGNLPDIPEMRRIIATYFNSVYRCDEVVGETLRALDEAGLADNTLVIYTSDNGMPFEFNKGECYPNSTRVPFIVRWPGVTQPGSVDGQHILPLVGLMPTLLEAAGIQEALPEMDEPSFLPVLQGQNRDGYERVLTEFHAHGEFKVPGLQAYPARAIQNKNYIYIATYWADGERERTVYHGSTESIDGVRALASKNPELREWLDFYFQRSLEEFYDLRIDPTCQNNLIHDPAYQAKIQEMRGHLIAEMERLDDRALEATRHIDDPQAVEAFMQSEQAVFDEAVNVANAAARARRQ